MPKMYRKYFKRVFDFVCSLLALIVLSPVLLITALLLRIKLGTPVIFKQKRPGLNEKIFTLYKFRTMTDKKDEQGNLLPNQLRQTKFGNFLRESSLDELPELVNILKGEMSFIGPRPLLIDYLDKYSNKQRMRHNVRPGLSGLAQVNGRNAISWEDKFRYDIEYVTKVSLILDLKILLLTFWKIFLREGIRANNNSFMEKFDDKIKEKDLDKRGLQ